MSMVIDALKNRRIAATNRSLPELVPAYALNW
jgi:hypothetical protein